MSKRQPYAERLGRIKDSVSKQRNERAKTEAHSVHGRVRKDVMAGMRFWTQVASGLHWIWQNILRPPLRPARWVVRKLTGGTRWTWNKVVYQKDEFGKPIFVKWRAGILILAYAGFVWFAMLPTVEFIWDVALYTTTAKRNEIVYLTKSQDIKPDDNEHSVIGCHAIPCDPQNSIYFRVRPVIFHHLWSLTHYSWKDGPPLFFPDNVAAAVPPGINTCVATSYGIRIKLFMRGFDWYPDLLAASCQPVIQGVPQ